MDQKILCGLIAQRVDPTKFQLWGTEVHWLVTPAQTDLDNVAAIIADYDNLAALYLQELELAAQAQALKEQQKAQAIADNLPSRAQALAAVDAAFSGAQRTIVRRIVEVLYWLAKNSEQ